MARLRRKFAALAIAFAGLVFATKKRRKPSPEQLHRMDFKSSAQKIGLHFPEILRDRLRHRWLRLK